ncbi:hypothetical protein AAV94_01125 [Lampropedia cohaerens]|uniref:Molybdopterin-synthase adenylyltransferase n=1 Tax=Lampropedia cohaerens TaxID=1610491 RepID=A0A0U1Q2S8_9BURK|nr:molybdopterin-synthase adenylyltransferase MoeB [Lampropedia cohaerens]KKW69044.1 hypothetical protein AAV94_01125 [Lampropedia cohaerens]
MTPRPPALAQAHGALSDAELARFARHLGLRGFGMEAQLRLKNARMLVIGAGGLGSAVLPYLAAAGVGTIGIVDDDVVELSNLQRQVLHGQTTLGQPKTASAAQRLHDLNPHMQVVEHRLRLDATNALPLLQEYDLVIDGSDNFATRYLVSDAAEVLRKPCVWGSILQFEGQVSVFWAGQGPTYRDLFPEPPEPGEVPSCAEAGVLGVVPGLIGCVMANEAIKLATGMGELLLGRLLLLDALAMRWQEMRLSPDPARLPVTALAPDYQALCGVPAAMAAFAQVSAQALQQQLVQAAESGEPAPMQVLDVREPHEFALGAIAGAQLLPLSQLRQGGGDDVLPPEGQRPLLLYCQSGRRALQAAELLQQRGFSRIALLDGGIERWQASGLPIEKKR